MFLSNRGSFRPETSGAYTLRRRGRRRPKSGSAIGACAVARLAGSGGPIGDYYGSANTNLIGATHIGIASCTIMLRETRILAKLLEQAGFCVETVGCKLESNRRADLDLEPPARGGEGGVVCNPIMQALLLNEAKTDLNILMGICVGHDALFCKYSDAPVTTFATKDFLAGNNPCAVLYTAHSCYEKKLARTVEEWRTSGPVTG